MKLIFVGCYCEDSQKDYLYSITNGHVSFSATTFQTAILYGLYKNSYTPDYIVNLPAISSFPRYCKSLYVKGSTFDYNGSKGYNCGFINLTYFKRFFSAWSIYLRLKKIIKKIDKNEQVVILSYSLMYHLLLPIRNLKNKYKDRDIKLITIVPDMPEFIDIPRHVKSLYDFSASIDGFVLLTAQMAERLKVGERPYVIIEGIYNSSDLVYPVSKEEKIILYSGTLDPRYGIVQLLNGFTRISDDSVKLCICGGGTQTEINEIIEYTKKDHRIEYLGILKREEVLLLQKKASFLVNPRSGKEEFTKYSFPSKTMEYLASGTPTIMFPLSGVPKEYLQYVILFTENQDDTIQCVLETVLKSNYRVYKDLALRAQKFILENKTSEQQVKKIINIFKCLI